MGLCNIKKQGKRLIINLLGVKIKIRRKTKNDNSEYNGNQDYYDCRRQENQKMFGCYAKVFRLHEQTFAEFKNKHFGGDIVLVATGPSLKKFKPIESAVYVGVNKAFQYNKVNFDYLFLQDFAGETPEYIDEFLAYHQEKTKKFLGNVDGDFYPASVIPQKYGINNANVARYYVAPWSWQDWFANDLTSEMLGDCFSIVFPAIQFILWTHPKRIYLVGCDCSKQGYYNSKNKNKLAVDLVIEGWRKLKEFVKIYYPDIEIISVNPVGLKGMFNDVYQDGGVENG